MKKYILMAFVGLLGLTACDSSLDVQPLDKVDLENYFRSASEMDLYSTAFYSILEGKPYSYQDDHIAKQVLSNELLCGDARVVPGSSSNWKWTTLRNINTLLEYAPKNCSDPEAVTKYSAVARFFRAYFYFDKVKRYGDVPWIDRQLFSTDDQLYAPRDSRELVMSKMLEDIDFAIENLPDSKAETNVAKVTKGAALALKSQFCLFEGTFRKYHGITLEGHDWQFYLQQCVDASDKLMSGQYGKYALYNTGKPASDYRDLFTRINAADTKGEYILSVAYSQTLSLYHNANTYAVGNNQGKPSLMRKLVASYLMKDGTRFTDKPGWQTMVFADEMKDRDPRLAQTLRAPGHKRYDENVVTSCNFQVSSTGYQPIKYVTAQRINNNDCDMTSRSLTDMPVFRYAEVLLNYAEAKAELGSLSQADLDKSINLLRKRAGMPDMKVGNSADPFLLSEEYGYFNCKDGDILEIRRERGIELVQENHRFWDLLRWKEGKCINQPWYGMYVPGPCELDMSGDGKPDVYFYAAGSTKPSVSGSAIALEIGKDIRLSQETKGNTCDHHTQNLQKFNEDRDYLYPIPSQQIELNPNLVQNPGWTK